MAPLISIHENCYHLNNPLSRFCCCIRTSVLSLFTPFQVTYLGLSPPFRFSMEPFHDTDHFAISPYLMIGQDDLQDMESSLTECGIPTGHPVLRFRFRIALVDVLPPLIERHCFPLSLRYVDFGWRVWF